MKIFIPTISTAIRLTQDWTFSVTNEGRNHKIVEAIQKARIGPDKVELRYGSWYDETYMLTLPAGTVLKFDRIYIRKGAGDFDSVTFTIGECPDKRFTSKKHKGMISGTPRFWTKLNFVNQIECELVE